MKQRYYEKGGGRGDKKRCLCLLCLHIASKLLHTKHSPPAKNKEGKKERNPGNQSRRSTPVETGYRDKKGETKTGGK